MLVISIDCGVICPIHLLQAQILNMYLEHI